VGSGGPSPAGTRDFLFFKKFTSVLGPTQPPVQWALGTLSPEVKRLAREADHPPPSSKVKVKFSLEHATKAQRGSRGIAVLFL
jgi:hypothetical protein